MGCAVSRLGYSQNQLQWHVTLQTRLFVCDALLHKDFSVSYVLKVQSQHLSDLSCYGPAASATMKSPVHIYGPGGQTFQTAWERNLSTRLRASGSQLCRGI
eukprot:259068-Amphidinium_carterae.1